LAAARAAHQAGTPDAPLRLLSVAEAGPLDQHRLGHANLLRARIAFTTERGRGSAGALLRAARQLDAFDVPLARDTYLEAISAAMFAGPLATGGGQLEVAEAALAAPRTAEPPRAFELLLDGLATLITEGYAGGVQRLRSALDAFMDPDLPVEEGVRWLWHAALAAGMVWDHDAWRLLATRHLQLATDTGQAVMQPFALSTRASVHVFAGELSEAASLVEEVRTVSEAVGISNPAYVAMMVAAWRGDEAEYAVLTGNVTAEATRRGEGVALIIGGWGRALLHNSLGAYADALAAASDAADHSRREVSVAVGWALVEYVEAAVRSGHADRAADVFRRLTERTGPSGTDWALGVEARSRALVSGDE
ncbi:LuxR family transcriptional regulator, partial [Streptomyces zhihengii]